MTESGLAWSFLRWYRVRITVPVIKIKDTHACETSILVTHGDKIHANFNPWQLVTGIVGNGGFHKCYAFCKVLLVPRENAGFSRSGGSSYEQVFEEKWAFIVTWKSLTLQNFRSHFKNGFSSVYFFDFAQLPNRVLPNYCLAHQTNSIFGQLHLQTTKWQQRAQ